MPGLPLEFVPVQLADEPTVAALPALPRRRSWPVRLVRGLGRLVEGGLGLLSLIAGLALLATIPIVQFVSLGFLLEASGRVGRTGCLRDAFFGIRTAALLGRMVLGTWLMILPLRLLADMAYSAHLLAPGSRTDILWRMGLAISTALVVVHIVLAWYSGGKLRHFFWPLLALPLFCLWLLRRLVASRLMTSRLRAGFERYAPRLLADLTEVPPPRDWFPPAIVWAGLRRGNFFAEARDAVWEFVQRFEPRYYFLLGAKGFFGVMLWLALPVLLLISSTRLPNGLNTLSGLLGGLGLAVAMLYLPFLQTRFAIQRRFAAFGEVREVRRLFRHAPLSFLSSLLFTLVLALPLYLLKIEATPREVTWLPSLVFVLFIYPARVLLGWAVGRASRRTRPAWRLLVWPCRVASFPVAVAYTFIVFLTQYTSWYGAWSLFEQHALLVPVPFLGG